MNLFDLIAADPNVSPEFKAAMAPIPPHVFMSPGTRVRFVPNYAQGDINHCGCQKGTVTRRGLILVYVRFDGTQFEQGCLAESLVLEPTEGQS